MNISLLLEMAADVFPERIAVGPRSAGLTYRDLLDRARSAGTALDGSGVARLALLDVNSAALPVALFASAYAHLPFVPLNYRLTDTEVRQLCIRTAPALLVTDGEMLHRVDDVPQVRVVTRSTFLSGQAIGDPHVQGPRDDSGDDIAVMLFTSGTTGKPKAALLRHRHLTSYVLGTTELGTAQPDDASLVSVPPYHVAAVSAILTGVYSGRRTVYLPTFRPEEWIDTVQREGITHAMVVPTMLGRILDALHERGDRPLSSLRHLSYGGGPMPTATIERALAALPEVDFVNGYGLTETASTIALLTPQDHRAAYASADPAIRSRLGSVGRPIPSVDLEIRDQDGRPVPPDGVGEIWVRGEQIAGEYDEAAGRIVGGWFATRDSGHIDAGGHLFVHGRLDDVIVRGGENISPGEIEEVIRCLPAVKDVAVVGVPDAEWGEGIAAFIVASGDAGDALTEQIRGQVRANLRSTRMPQLIRFVDALPYNETGKLLRRVLRDQVLA